MARDSKSNTSKARRSSTSTATSNSTITSTRSRFSAVQPVQHPSGPFSSPGKAAYPSSEAGWSNITGFRPDTKLAVAGSPPSSYFNNGDSKVDRRAEYIGRELTESCFIPSNPQPQPSYYSGRPEREESLDEDVGSEDDSATVLPSDSVSQVGRGRDRARERERPRGLFGEVRRGGGVAPMSMPMASGSRVGVQRSQTYPDVGGGYQQSFGGGRRYSVVERKPQMA